MCSFTSFVVNKLSCGGLPSNAALCRSRPISRHGKIALLVETNDTIQTEGHYETAIFPYDHGIYFQRGLAQQGSRLPDNRELVTRARSYYVETDTFYMKREALESSLLGQEGI